MSADELEGLGLPANESFGPGRAWRTSGVHGRVYADLPAALAQAVPHWLASLSVPEGSLLKAPDVHRVGSLVVKFFHQPSLLGWLRQPRAVRSAERHFWALPLRSPRPWIAAGRGTGRPSLLVREHVEGRLLQEVWGRDEAAEESLAAFLADMERHSVVHGDLHPRNLLWSGEEWVLLDVDGLRHGLHSTARVLSGQWARFVVYLGDEERVRRLHQRSGELLGGRARVSWKAVQKRTAALVADRAGAPLW